MKTNAILSFALAVALAPPAAAQEPAGTEGSQGTGSHGGGTHGGGTHGGGTHGGGAGGQHELGNVIRDFSRIPTANPIETAERGARVVRRHAGGGLHREQILRAIGNPEIVTAPVSQELRYHARRVARLTRIRSLAGEAGRNDLVARSRRALRLEMRRHQARLGTLVGRDVDLGPAGARR